MSVECKHDQGIELATTKSEVYVVCIVCGARVEKVDKEVVIEKVVVPVAMEKG